MKLTLKWDGETDDVKRAFVVAEENDGWQDLRIEVDTDDCDREHAKKMMQEVMDRCNRGPSSSLNLNELSKAVHAANIKWWQDVETGQPIKRNKGELIALEHSELSECLEGERKNLMDDKLPQFPMAVVEQVDCMIRILDYLAGFYPDHNVQEVFDAKMAFNAQREDHKHEARKIAGGKQF